VAGAAVDPAPDALSGQAIVAFVTLNAGLSGDDAVAAEIRTYVGERIGKLARPKSIIWAEDLPKTRSGKIMRRLLRDIAEGRELGDVTTLGDASILQRLQEKAAARAATPS
jgi:acetyl-CoA synthetase